MSGNTIWPQASGFQKLAIDHFGDFFYETSTLKMNVARFARNVKCDFLCDIQTLWQEIRKLSWWHSVWKSPKMSVFQFLALSTNFCPIKSELSGNTVWPQASGFQKLAKLTIFNELLSTQNVNVARFARNVEWDFLGDFQTLCSC